MNAIAHTNPITLAGYAALVAKPFAAVPFDCREHALRLWVCHRHLNGLDSGLAIAGPIAVWVGQHGLDPADIAEICDRLTHPSKMAKHKFGSDLVTELATLASAAIEKREQHQRAEERRKQNQPNPELNKILEGLADGLSLSTADDSAG